MNFIYVIKFINLIIYIYIHVEVVDNFKDSRDKGGKEDLIILIIHIKLILIEKKFPQKLLFFNVDTRNI